MNRTVVASYHGRVKTCIYTMNHAHVINQCFEKEEAAMFCCHSWLWVWGQHPRQWHLRSASRNATDTSSSWQRMWRSRWFWQKDRRFESQCGGLWSLITVCAKCLTEGWHTNSGHRYFYGLHSCDAPPQEMKRYNDTLRLKLHFTPRFITPTLGEGGLDLV